jgi:hypothetical protein
VPPYILVYSRLCIRALCAPVFRIHVVAEEVAVTTVLASDGTALDRQLVLSDVIDLMLLCTSLLRLLLLLSFSCLPHSTEQQKDLSLRFFGGGSGAS